MTHFGEEVALTYTCITEGVHVKPNNVKTSERRDEEGFEKKMKAVKPSLVNL